VREITRLLLGALVLVALALGVLRPLIRNLASQVIAPAPAPMLEAQPADARAVGAGQQLAYEQQIVQARNLVTQDPKRVAQVVKTWVQQ
jgi:flagellar M-ring protein FliF